MELAVAVDPEHEDAAMAALALVPGARGAWCERPGLVRGYFDTRLESEIVRAFRAAWREVASPAPAPTVTMRPVPGADWLASFRRAARPARVGARLWIVPPDAPPPPGGWPPGMVAVLIRPGQGFGTGTHPTTRALLRWLEDEPGYATVLDVGTGSGILGLAAIALGARRAVALEIDEAAVENAAENRALNRARGLALVRGTLDAVQEGTRFDRVLANLDRAALAELVPGLALRVAPGGRLGLAGLLTGEETEILELAERSGLAPAARSTDEDPATGDRWWSGWLAPQGREGWRTQ